MKSGDGHLVRGRRRCDRAGYSLVEATICIVIVGGMFAAVAHTLSATRLAERQIRERAQAHMLAQALIDESMRQAYEDPGQNPVFGPEPGEDDGTRRYFDDVDDYHGWAASPPMRRDGTPVTDFEPWTRSAEVHWVDPDNPNQVMNHETGLKRVTVTVRRGDAVIARLTALRSRALDKRRPTGAIAP